MIEVCDTEAVCCLEKKATSESDSVRVLKSETPCSLPLPLVCVCVSYDQKDEKLKKKILTIRHNLDQEKKKISRNYAAGENYKFFFQKN